MNLHKGNRLKPIVKVLSEWDQGVIHGLAWLEARGMSRVQVHRACSPGELRRIGSGVFMRIADEHTWPAAIEALQTEFQFPVHVGRLSALELQGAAHQLRLHRKEVDLITYRNRNLPRWLTDNNWDVKFRYHRSDLFK
jgi:hypothetical protein